MANERRLIDVDAAIERLRLESVMRYPQSWGMGLLAAMETLRGFPTVEAVEVVRCKNCCWNDRDGRCMNPKCGKSWYGCPVPDEHYCSYGEKREVE